MGANKYFKMENPHRIGPVEVQTTHQQRELGSILAQAVTEGRAFQIQKGKENSILVLLSAADDLGHVYQIHLNGPTADIGVTEKPLGR